MVFFGCRPDEAVEALEPAATWGSASHSKIKSWRKYGKIAADARPGLKRAWTLSLPSSKTHISYVYVLPQDEEGADRAAAETWKDFGAVLKSVFGALSQAAEE